MICLLKESPFSTEKTRGAKSRRAIISETINRGRDDGHDQKKENSSEFMGFGKDYFDGGDKSLGYGSYRYDGRYSKAIEKIIKDYRLNPEMIIFEAGCAKGFIVQEFLQRGFLKSFGQDISEYAISSANEKCKAHLKIGSINSIQSSDESVDFLYSKEVLPHMSEGDIKLFLSECNRVLKKNGQIILEIQYSNSAKGRELMKIWDPTHVTLFSKEEWLNLIKNKFNKCGLFIHFKELF